MEADIRSFFDHIDHGWMVKMLEQRIADRPLIRLIVKWLKAGVLDTDGKVVHPATGTPHSAHRRRNAEETIDPNPATCLSMSCKPNESTRSVLRVFPSSLVR